MKSVILTLLVAVALLSGCAPKNYSIRGAWKLAKPSSPGNSITYTFNTDGTYSYVQHAAFEEIHSHQSSQGTYTFSHNTLTINTKHAVMGIDADTIAAIDAREEQDNPKLHVPQDKGDVPIRILQPTTIFAVNFLGNGETARFKDKGNYADHGVLYKRADQGIWARLARLKF